MSLLYYSDTNPKNNINCLLEDYENLFIQFFKNGGGYTDDLSYYNDIIVAKHYDNICDDITTIRSQYALGPATVCIARVKNTADTYYDSLSLYKANGEWVKYHLISDSVKPEIPTDDHGILLAFTAIANICNTSVFNAFENKRITANCSCVYALSFLIKHKIIKSEEQLSAFDIFKDSVYQMSFSVAYDYLIKNAWSISTFRDVMKARVVALCYTGSVGLSHETFTSPPLIGILQYDDKE